MVGMDAKDRAGTWEAERAMRLSVVVAMMDMVMFCFCAFCFGLVLP